MKLTEFLSLKKPLTIEKYDVNIFNENSDTIDSALSKLTSDLSADSKDINKKINETNQTVKTNKADADNKIKEHSDNGDIHFTTMERQKLKGIESGAQVNTITGIKGNKETDYRVGKINLTPADLGADAEGSASQAIKDAENYTDAVAATKINLSQIDMPNGVAPLDADRKLPSANLSFGTTVGTCFEGSNGHKLQEDFETHTTVSDASFKKLTRDINAEITRASNNETQITTRLTAETTRAREAEEGITNNLNAEITRAKAAEKTNSDAIASETTRAKAAEKSNTNAIAAETSRAKAAEKANTDAITAEVDRANTVEKANASAIAAESSRAIAAEKVNTDAIAAEAARAKTKEDTLSKNLSTETTRATTAEKKNADAISAETSRAKTAEASITQTIQTNKPVWEDKYTKNEIDNKFSTLEMATDWKESVAGFSNLASTYPNPQDGWTVNVKDTNITYRYDGKNWIAISANAIPKATQSVDGLLSKEDKKLYDDTNSKKHTHSNKSVLDGITAALIASWNHAVAHITDTVKHITANERTKWNEASDKVAKIETGAQVNKVTGIKGNAESVYRTGNVNLTPADIGAAASGHTHNNYASTIKTTGSGNAVTAITQSGNTVTASKDASFLPLTGGKIIGIVEMPLYIYHGYTGAGQGKEGYFKFARISITREYMNSAIQLTVIQRQLNKPTNLYLRFTNASTVADTVVGHWICDNDNWNGYYIAKNSDGVYDLYAKKADAWDTLCCVNFKKSQYAFSKLNVSFLDEFVETLPKGYITAEFENIASKLNATHTINGTVFNGTKDITTNKWGVSRNLTIGNAVKKADGSADVTYSLTEIGAAAANHSHDYLPLTGGNMTGVINSNVLSNTYLQGNRGIAIINSSTPSGSYTMLAKMNSTNGYFTHGSWQDKYVICYTAKSTVNAGINDTTYSASLLNEAGQSNFPMGVNIGTSNTFPSTSAYSIISGQHVNMTHSTSCICVGNSCTVAGSNTSATFGNSNKNCAPQSIAAGNLLTVGVEGNTQAGFRTAVFGGSNSVGIKAGAYGIGDIVGGYGNSVNLNESVVAGNNNNFGIAQQGSGGCFISGSKNSCAPDKNVSGSVIAGFENYVDTIANSIVIGGNNVVGAAAYCGCIGNLCTVNNINQFVSGYKSMTAGIGSVAFGNQIYSHGMYGFGCGQYNAPMDDYFFTVGCGTSDTTRANAFRVSRGGYCYAKGTFSNGGADYAELLEWEDGNPYEEDRRGLFVALKGKKIVIADSAAENIIGVISGNPAMLGNNYSDTWKDQYLTDLWGKVILSEQLVAEEIITEKYVEEDIETGEMKEKTRVIAVIPEHREMLPMVNPEYDSTKKYMPREERPEWGAVGMLGQLIVIDDGTCQVGSYCTIAKGGTGTAVEQKANLSKTLPANKKDGWYVMERINADHILILFK